MVFSNESTEAGAVGLVPALSVSDLVVEFTSGKYVKRVVDQVSFDVVAGQTLGLVGQSGSGKSMTALAVMGLLRRTRFASVEGSVRLLGEELTTKSNRALASVRGTSISLVMQDPMSSLNPAFTIGEQIAETARVHEGASRAQARRRAIEMLRLVEIPAAERRVDAYPHEFSGGMRQRAMLAIALSCNPKVLVADEPTTALDVTVQAQILELIRRIQSELGMAVLFITHDLGVVAEICDRVAVMYAGQIVETAEVVELFENLHHPYTEELLRSTPEFLTLDPTRGPTSGVAAKSGCRFLTQCRFAEFDRCADEIALATSEQPDHLVRCVRWSEIELESGPSLWARLSA